MKPTTLALAALCLSIVACKSESKLDKCNKVCEKIYKEDVARCAGDAACLDSVARTKSSCNSLCQTVTKKREKPKSGEELIAKCEGGDGESCIDAAGAYLKGLRGLSASPEKATSYLKKGCELGNADACEYFAKSLRDGRGVKADPARAKVLLKKACDKGSAGACASVGLELMQGSKADKAKGLALLEDSCGKKNKLACMGAGGAYLHGNGVAKNRVKAKALLSSACDLGATKACDVARTL